MGLVFYVTHQLKKCFACEKSVLMNNSCSIHLHLSTCARDSVCGGGGGVARCHINRVHWQNMLLTTQTQLQSSSILSVHNSVITEIINCNVCD